MEKDIAIRICNLSKSFSYSKRNLNKKVEKITNTVLDNISIDIKKGEVIGILGRNGCGKSTFLSILSKIIEPDSGTIMRNGTIASILELGMGFHREMSGRENIYLKGELYGLSKNEINSKIDSIIAYSGLSDYIDNPIKTYSSGMESRLAFSILINIQADILIVDEVLSTGDIAFASKASQHFKTLSKSGKTIIIVSHNLALIETICTRVIWLENGKINQDGSPKIICSKYRNAMASDPETQMDLALADVPDAQYNVAIMFRDGTYFEKNMEEYHHWIKKASDNGHTLAQMEYADILFNNNNESEEALLLYGAAAEKGNETARQKIAYLQNKQSNIDRNNLIEIYRKLSESKNPYYQHLYAELLLKTAKTVEEKQLAKEQFELSAAQGNPESLHSLAIMSRDGEGTKRDYKSMENYLKQAADHNLIKSVIYLADLYFDGKLLPKNDEYAFEYYLRSAKLGVAKAQYRVATMYRDGIGVLADLNESKKWMECYAANMLSNYQLIAADVINTLDLNSETELTLLEKSAESYNARALYSLAIHYRDGINVLPNPPKAANYLIESAKSFGKYRTILADHYFKGFTLPQNTEVAIQLYKDGISMGDGNAAFKLALVYKENGQNEEFVKYLNMACQKGVREAILMKNAIEQKTICSP